MASRLVLPAYDGGGLCDLLPAVCAHLGVSNGDDPLRLPPSQRYVVVLVDGLGWNLLRRSIRDAPYLSSLLGDGRPLTVGVPSTTATSLASLGTGLPPGQHGVVGYLSRVPATGELLNALTWESKLDPLTYQTQPTWFEWAATSGVKVSSVALERFRGTGLTIAALRGPDFVSFESESAVEQRLELTVAAAVGGRRSLVYAYERELDHDGHAYGCGSARWLARLRRVDDFCERLRDRLPDDVALIITGDHGMVDVPKHRQILFEDSVELQAGVDACAGEGRFRQLYVDGDSVDAVARRWSAVLGDRAWVRTRDEAIDEGWFGPVAGPLRERWGHVLVAMRDDHAVMTRALPRELTLVGMHGSLTSEEMVVPLLCDAG